MMETKNYIKLSNFSLFNYQFMYLDTEEYLADAIFAYNNLSVHFYKGELVHPDWPYRIIHCKIRKKDEELFYKCMEYLVKKMMICGHTDYEEFSNTLIRLFTLSRPTYE